MKNANFDRVLLGDDETQKLKHLTDHSTTLYTAVEAYIRPIGDQEIGGYETQN